MNGSRLGGDAHRSGLSQSKDAHGGNAWNGSRLGGDAHRSGLSQSKDAHGGNGWNGSRLGGDAHRSGAAAHGGDAWKKLWGIALGVALLAQAMPAAAWGDRTHAFVNGLAVEILPEGARDFFRRHREEIETRANEPDTLLRARHGRAEAIRHFIDLDALMPPPFTGFPRFYPEAARRFGRKNLERNGILPWVILRFRRQLKEALARADEPAAVREAAYLGHYVADAYQPLHLTDNHDGQKTGATGIHKRFENGLVDAELDRYAERVRKSLRPAVRLRDPRTELFTEMFATYAGVEDILRADRLARERSKVGSDAYYRDLDRYLGPLAVRQLGAAATMLGSFWMTAWEESKRPANLDSHPNDR